MGLPDDSDNHKGYIGGSLLNKFERLRGKDFMINHGVAGKKTFIFCFCNLCVVRKTCFSDDNVHYQHSMMLIRALEKADVQFIQNSYPGD